MATTTKTTHNVYQKLIAARQDFLKANIAQSGKNMRLEFTYFELDDIVPTITEIFNKRGLIAIDNFSPDLAMLTIVNVDKPEETIDFSAPFNQIEPIISNLGKQVTNNMQALGASITYMRRYMYLIALDICVNDEIEAGIDETTNNQGTPKNTVQIKRNEIKKELTDGEGKATELQITALKNVMKKLREKDSSKDEMIARIAVQTNNFTEITKEDCEKLIKKIGEML